MMTTACGRPQHGSRNRRGATLVLVALFITILVGMVGVVIDFGRFYVYRTQMQTTVDAASLAGAIELARQDPTGAPDTALDYVPVNQVDGGSATVPLSSVQPVIWNFSSGTGAVAASWSTAGVNAVQVTATHPASYTFGVVWSGGPSLTLTTTATAAVAYVGTTNCLKPWTISYQTLLDALYPPAGTKSPTYNLTAADIAKLAAMGPANVLPLLLTTSNPVSPGNIAAVQVSSPWSGNASYKAAIDGACPNDQIGPGSILQTDPGEGSGQTANALQQFCNDNGGTSGNGNTFTCTAAPKIKMAMWDTNNGASGSNLTYHVKYVGVFAVTGFSKKSGVESITGYFSSMASEGAASSTPGPITEGILVK